MSQIGYKRTRGEQQEAADRFSDIGGNAILYAYPTGQVDIICAAEKWFTPPGWEGAEDFARKGKALPAKREKGKKSEGTDMERSMRRARAQLRRLALANSFEYFVTLTLDGDRIDRYDGAAVTKALSQWCDNMVRRHGLRYILVPERHKSGRIHFHGFFNDVMEVKPSNKMDSSGHPIFNLPEWDYGFTTAIELYGDYHSAAGAAGERKVH